MKERTNERTNERKKQTNAWMDGWTKELILNKLTFLKIIVVVNAI